MRRRCENGGKAFGKAKLCEGSANTFLKGRGRKGPRRLCESHAVVLFRVQKRRCAAFRKASLLLRSFCEDSARPFAKALFLRRRCEGVLRRPWGRLCEAQGSGKGKALRAFSYVGTGRLRFKEQVQLKRPRAGQPRRNLELCSPFPFGALPPPSHGNGSKTKRLLMITTLPPLPRPPPPSAAAAEGEGVV